MRAIALMYHDVTPAGRESASGFLGGDAARYKLSPREFDAHLEAIHARAPHAPVTVETIGGPAPSLLLTFDDGGESASAAADALERHGWRGHFFITTGRVDRPGFLQRNMVRELKRRGHVIGSHSHTHPLRMSHCSEGRLLDEWRRSIAILSDITGEAVTCASIPGGHHSRLVLRTAADCGARFLFTSEPTLRVQRLGDAWVFGRFAIQRSTGAAAAAAIAAGDLRPRLALAAFWAAKGVCKTLGGSAYLRVRERILGRSSMPQWGDEQGMSEDAS